MLFFNTRLSKFDAGKFIDLESSQLLIALNDEILKLRGAAGGFFQAGIWLCQDFGGQTWKCDLRSEGGVCVGGASS